MENLVVRMSIYRVENTSCGHDLAGVTDSGG